MPRVAARNGLANKRPARTTLLSETSSAGKPPTRTAASVPNGCMAPATLRERWIDDVGRFGERTDENDAARPVAGFIALGQFRQPRRSRDETTHAGRWRSANGRP